MPPPEAEALRIARIHQHLSVREAAQRAGVSVSLWRQVEAGYMTPVKGVHMPKIAPAATLARMAQAVDLQAEHLESRGQRPDAAEILRAILHHEVEAADAPAVIPAGSLPSAPMDDDARNPLASTG
jgi:transcriptional regulator with XRE-family HTH domain